MIRHYFTIAIRNLAKQKILAIINVLGLSIGIACFSLFLLYAVNEFSYDRFHAHADKIYRVHEWMDGMENRHAGGEAPGYTPLGPAMKQDLPDVVDYVRFETEREEKFVRINNNVTRNRLSFADPGIFKVFSFKLLEGNSSTALTSPGNIVLTKNKANQLFGSTQVVGKRLDIQVEDAFIPFTVGAVCENIPTNSSINFDLLGSYEFLLTTKIGMESRNNWQMQIGSETYVQLRNGSNLPNEPKKLAAFRRKYYPNELKELKDLGLWKGDGPPPLSFNLQPLKSVHTNPKIGGMSDTIDPKIIWILVAIATGVLLIACINFTTLAIGRSVGRANETGVRKVMGSSTRQIVYQFLTESILLSVFSGVLGFFLAKLLLPYFNALSGRSLEFSFSNYPELVWMLAALTLLTGFLAGSYPAYVLSRFKPADVFKSKIRLGGSNIFTRSLVTIQFVLSTGLIICSFIILKQLNHLQSQNLGFEKEHVVVVNAQGTDGKKILPLFRQALQSRPEIRGIAGSNMGLGEGAGLMSTMVNFKGSMKGVVIFPVDAEYLNVMGMKLIAGRNFDNRIPDDVKHSVIVNESFLKVIEMNPGNAIGQEVSEMQFEKEPVQRTIIGVIKNFNYSPLRQDIRPQMFFQPEAMSATHFFVKIQRGNPSKSIAAIQEEWKSIVPGIPLAYSFIDDDFDRFYKGEERWGSVAGWAGGISIFLACLGLFGLAALTAANRTKEIGIRKVLGSSVAHLIGLLSKDFLKLVMIALLIASPLSWYIMHQWLQDYVYRTEISWWIFVVAAIITTALAIGTVAFQAVKASFLNPVKCLRSE